MNIKEEKMHANHHRLQENLPQTLLFYRTVGDKARILPMCVCKVDTRGCHDLFGVPFLGRPQEGNDNPLSMSGITKMLSTCSERLCKVMPSSTTSLLIFF